MLALLQQPPDVHHVGGVTGGVEPLDTRQVTVRQVLAGHLHVRVREAEHDGRAVLLDPVQHALAARVGVVDHRRPQHQTQQGVRHRRDVVARQRQQPRAGAAVQTVRQPAQRPVEQGRVGVERRLRDARGTGRVGDEDGVVRGVPERVVLRTVRPVLGGDLGLQCHERRRHVVLQVLLELLVPGLAGHDAHDPLPADVLAPGLQRHVGVHQGRDRADAGERHQVQREVGDRRGHDGDRVLGPHTLAPVEPGVGRHNLLQLAEGEHRRDGRRPERASCRRATAPARPGTRPYRGSRCSALPAPRARSSRIARRSSSLIIMVSSPVSCGGVRANLRRCRVGAVHGPVDQGCGGSEVALGIEEFVERVEARGPSVDESGLLQGTPQRIGRGHSQLRVPHRAGHGAPWPAAGPVPGRAPRTAARPPDCCRSGTGSRGPGRPPRPGPRASSAAVWLAPAASRRHSRSGCHSACHAPEDRSSSATIDWLSTSAYTGSCRAAVATRTLSTGFRFCGIAEDCPRPTAAGSATSAISVRDRTSTSAANLPSAPPTKLSTAARSAIGVRTACQGSAGRARPNSSATSVASRSSGWSSVAPAAIRWSW